MKVSRQWRLLIFLVAAFLALWFVLGNESQDQQDDPLPSSFNATFPGLKAWYLLLHDLGIKTERLTGAFPKSLQTPGTLVIAEPTVPVTLAQTDEIVKWVRGGGRLLLALGGSGSARLEKRLGVEQKVVGILGGSVSPVFPTPMGRRVGPVRGGDFRLSRTPPNAVEEYGDQKGPLLVHWAEGRGEVTVLADSYPLTNESIDKEGNARLAVWLAGAGPVVFDEIHLGYTSSQEPNFWRQLGSPLRLAFYQLLLAALLVGWTLSRRFGYPITPRPDLRTSGEFILSLGKLLQRAKAERTALEVIGQQFRHELSRWAGAPEDLPDELLLSTVTERTSLPRSTIERALQASHGQPPAGMNTLEACQLIATVRKELQLHGRFAVTAG